MARTPGTGRGSNGRRRAQRSAGGTGTVVSQITEIIARNQTLQRENRELTEENRRLRDQLSEIGSALGRLTGGTRAPAAKPRRERRPITDPEALERRRQALVKARAARAEKLAAAKGGSTDGS